MFNEVSRRHDKRKITETRKQEIEDSPQILDKKCERMAKAIQKVRCIYLFFIANKNSHWLIGIPGKFSSII